jgi:hypothetical protein
MDNLVTLYHGGSVEKDQFGNVDFVGMQTVPLMFDERPLFSELMGSARDELKCNSNEEEILVEGVIHHGGSGTIFRRLVPIVSEVQWDKYVKTVMKSEFKCLDLVVRNLSKEPGPLVDSPLNWQPPIGPLVDNPAPSASLIPIQNVGVEDVVAVPDAQSGPNEVGCVHTPMTQTIPCKWRSCIIHFVSIPSFDLVVSIVCIFVVLL